MRLDARLETIAGLVRPGSVVADIGCDHGYLICALVARGVCPRGFACDVNAGPLARARRNVLAQGLERCVELVRTDGLRGLPHDEIDDIVIAGMGGDLIAQILLDVPWTRCGRYRFILQPMTKAEHLRRILSENGFVVEEERAVCEGRFCYTVMAVSCTGEAFEPTPLFQWAGLHFERGGADSDKYLLNVSRVLFQKAEGLLAAGRAEESAEFESLARMIRERAGK